MSMYHRGRQQEFRMAEGACLVLASLLTLLTTLGACTSRDPEIAAGDDAPFDGPYPVEELFEQVDKYDEQFCACAKARGGPQTTEECHATYESGWREGEDLRICLDMLGHQEEWHDNTWITECSFESLEIEFIVLERCDFDLELATANPLRRNGPCPEWGGASDLYPSVA